MDTKIIINSNSELLKDHNVNNGDSLTEEEAKDLAKKINESHKGKAIVENNELKVKDLIVG